MAKGFAGIIEMAFDEQSAIQKTALQNKVCSKFDKELFAEYIEIGDVYMQQEYQTLDSWLAKMIIVFGNDEEPWLRAVWSILSSNKTGKPFDAKKIAAVMAAVGSCYEHGTTSFDDMKNEFKKLLKGKYNAVLPMIESSFYGVEALFNFKRNS